MKKYYSIIKKSTLFSGLSNEEIEKMLACLHCTPKQFAAGETIFTTGDILIGAGLILFGETQAESVSFGGEKSIVSKFLPSDIFGDVLMARNDLGAPITMTTLKDCKILFIPFENLMSGCQSNCSSHEKIRINFLQEIAKKFFMLNKKINYLSNQSLRNRIIDFLFDTMQEKGSKTFDINMSREEMAGLLSVNRSALSRELSRMRNEKLISFYKSSFKIEDEAKLFS